MTDDLSPQEERRGVRHLFVGGIVAAIVLGVGVAVWPWLPGVERPSAPTATTGTRSHQSQGASEVARTTAPPRNANPSDTTAETTGRAANITASATRDLSLTDEQRNAVNDFAMRHRAERNEHVDFTISIGAAVPQQLGLHDIPVTLSDRLAAYSGDQYFLAPNQLIVVEKQTRRIVAIIPAST